MGIAQHTEEENLLVLYVPLRDDEKTTSLHGATMRARPLSERYTLIDNNGCTQTRFTKIS
jgi:hypothetical protein